MKGRDRGRGTVEEGRRRRQMAIRASLSETKV